MNHTAPAFVCTLTALLVAGCSADTANYPSLAKRPVERITGSAEVVPAQPVPEAVPAPPSAELSARLAQLVDEAGAAHQTFSAKREEATRLVAAAQGAEVASENWSVAAVALAELEAARSRAMIALADLDALYAAQVVETGQASEIDAARERVIALVGQEDSVLAELRNKLPA